MMKVDLSAFKETLGGEVEIKAERDKARELLRGFDCLWGILETFRNEYDIPWKKFWDMMVEYCSDQASQCCGSPDEKLDYDANQLVCGNCGMVFH